MATLKNKKIIIIVTVCTAVVLVVLGYLWYRNTHKPKTTQQTSQTEQNQSAQSESNQETQETPTSSTPKTPATAPQAPAKPPTTPTFTKSSGNNGPVPVNVLLDFVCNSEPGTTCQIILTSGSRQIALPEQQVKDNGRGQWFTSWNWTSVSGSWSVIARAKNTQGGVADSNKQALEVK